MARRSLPLGHIRTRHRKARALPRMRGRDRFRFDDKDGGVRSSAGKGAGTLAGDGFAQCSMSATVPPLMRWRWCVTWLCHPVGANPAGAPGE